MVEGNTTVTVISCGEIEGNTTVISSGVIEGDTTVISCE